MERKLFHTLLVLICVQLFFFLSYLKQLAALSLMPVVEMHSRKMCKGTKFEENVFFRIVLKSLG
jgi:hypothetical protein